MFRRKLVALGHGNPVEEFGDEMDFRKLILWLEDQKIRHYKIADRTELRQIDSADWLSSLKKYLSDIECSVVIQEDDISDRSIRAALIDWILGFAVRLEYGDNVDKYKSARTDSSPPTGSTGTLLDSVDFNSDEFRAGVASLAKLLQIPSNPNHLVVLEAVSIVVTQHLSKEALERGEKKGGGTYIPLDKVDLGFDVTDPVVREAAKILRLLHIRELRDLQNLANEAIVAVQAITANPKTDSKLGKVGT